MTTSIVAPPSKGCFFSSFSVIGTLLVVLGAARAVAAPIYEPVETIITQGQYQTALEGAADPATFLQGFFGYPLGTLFCCFNITELPNFSYLIVAEVAVPDVMVPEPPPMPPPPPIQPPPFLPPPPPPNPAAPPETPPAATPEPGTLLLVGVALICFGAVRWNSACWLKGNVHRSSGTGTARG